MELKKLVSKATDEISKNSPAILTGISIVGYFGALAFAISGTKTSMEQLQDVAERRFKDWENQTGEDPSSYPVEMFSTWEIIKLVWKNYVPAAVLFGLSTACAITSLSENSRRIAAVSTLYTLGEKAMDVYQEKVVEVVGEKKEAKIKELLAEKALTDRQIDGSLVINTGKGNHLIFDSLSGRYFMSDLETIRQVVNEFNLELIADGWKSVNEFYFDIGLEPTRLGEDTGWRSDTGLLDINYTAKLAGDRPCAVMQYRVVPRYLP